VRSPQHACWEHRALTLECALEHRALTPECALEHRALNPRCVTQISTLGNRGAAKGTLSDTYFIVVYIK
jgi:hypothetical protein